MKDDVREGIWEAKAEYWEQIVNDMDHLSIIHSDPADFSVDSPRIFSREKWDRVMERAAEKMVNDYEPEGEDVEVYFLDPADQEEVELGDDLEMIEYNLGLKGPLGSSYVEWYSWSEDTELPGRSFRLYSAEQGPNHEVSGSLRDLTSSFLAEIDRQIDEAYEH